MSRNHFCISANEMAHVLGKVTCRELSNGPLVRDLVAATGLASQFVRCLAKLLCQTDHQQLIEPHFCGLIEAVRLKICQFAFAHNTFMKDSQKHVFLESATHRKPSSVAI